MTDQMKTKVFDCPVHGWEIQAFCFRSELPENADRWHKATITLDEEK